ncbi:MAG: glycosyltransferase family 2 protein [Pyrinomonadaceae bacterium]
MKLKRIEVVAPVFNRRDITLQCLRSLSRIDLTGIELHIIIVDDASTDGTGDALREQFPDVQVIDGTGDLWYTAGTNLGVEAALEHDPDYILCINDDSIFDADAVRKMVDCAERHPRSVIGALLLLWDEPHRVFQVAPKWNTLRGGWQHWYQQTVWSVPQSAWEVEMIVGNCVLYPAKVFAEVGMMNPEISAQYGDAEFTTRIRKNGWRLLIEPSARVFCKPNYTHISVLGLPFRKQIETFFTNTRSGSNLIHQLRQSWHTAPTRVQGLTAFFMFYINWLWRKIANVRSDKDEKSLAEIYADKLI